MKDILPPFQVDYEYLTDVAVTSGHVRALSATTIHMCLAALQAMKYNRYWRAGDDWLSTAQIEAKNDMVDLAVYELLEVIGLPDDIIDEFVSTPPQFGGGCSDESEETMSCINVLYIGGIPYLVKDCGCEDARFFQLLPANVALDPESGGVSISEEPDTGGIDFADARADYLSCIADSFVPYALNLAANYQAMIVNIAQTGIDILSGFDEIFDIVALAAAWLTGNSDMQDWGELVIVDVAGAFADEDLITHMTTTFETMWNGQPFTRETLHNWVMTAPQFVSGLPVRWLMDDWAQYCNLRNLNSQLMMIQSSCQGDSGYTPPGGIFPLYYSYGGLMYPLLEVELGGIMLPETGNLQSWGTNYWEIPADYQFEEMIGVFFEYVVSNTAGNAVDCRIHNGERANETGGHGNGTYYRGYGGATAVSLITAYTGDTFTGGDDYADTSTPRIERRYGDDWGNHVHVSLSKLYVIGPGVAM